MSFRDRRPWGRMFENQLPEFLELVVPADISDREEAEFTMAMVKGLNEELKGQGLGCFFFGPNIMNTGYRVGFLDAERRRYYTGFKFDEAISLAENYPGRGFQELLKLMCERALLERELQFQKNKADAVLTLNEVVAENVPN
jgi:hypothetical protein